MAGNGIPLELSYAPGDSSLTPLARAMQFQTVLDALAIQFHLTYRTQTKGKENRTTGLASYELSAAT
jgi:hypothetical protein